MAVSYKGLTIKFGGDTTQLQSALKKIQTDSRATQSDLKDINKALKFNPGNTELLEQKVRSLNKAYNETKDRLAAYKAALAELDAKKQSGQQLTEQEQRQYEQLQRSIMSCEKDLESYGRQIREVSTEAEASKDKLYQLGQTIEDNADKLKSAGDKISSVGTKSTAVFGGVATAAYGAFTQLEEGENIAIKGAGAIGDAAEEIRRSVKSVAAQAPGDFNTVGQAVGDVNTHFRVTGDELDDISTKFLKFAKVTDSDVSKSVENVSMSMKAWNVDQSETGNLLDHIASVSTATGVSVDALTSGVNTNGATFREMGLSLQDSITLMGNFEAAGVPVDGMLTGLKKAAANCAKEGTNMGDVLSGLVQDLQDPAKQSEATAQAFDLFGSKAATSFIDAAESGRINLSDLGGSMDDAAGFVDGLKDETTTAADKMKGAFKDITIAGADIGEQFAPVVEDAAGALKSFGEWAKSLSPEQKKLAAKLIEGGIAFGVVATGIGKVVSGLPAFASGLKTASTGFKAFSAVLSANPIMVVVGLIATIVAAIVTWVTTTDEGKQAWEGFCGGAKEAWQGVCDFFGGAADFFGGIWSTVTGGISDFVSGAKQKWDDLKTGASEKWQEIKDGASEKWEGVKSAISEKIDGAKEAVTSKASEIAQGASEKWDQLKSDASEKWQSLKDGAATYFGGIKDTIQNDMQTGKTVASASSSALKSALSGDWDSAKQQAATAFSAIKDNIQTKMSNAKTNAINAGNAIGEKLGFPGLGSKVASVFATIKSNITSPISDAWNFISGIPGRIQGAFSGIRISLPHINMPHFSVSWRDIGGVVKLPSISVNWYAKGASFDRPSIIGVGEAGLEHVTPDAKLRTSVRESVEAGIARAMNLFRGGGGAAAQVSVTVNATIADKVDAYTTGQQIGAGIASRLKQRGVPVGA